MSTNNLHSIINLSSLIDLSGKLNESDDDKFILNSTILSLMGKLKIIRAAVFYPEEDNFSLIISKPQLHVLNIKSFEIENFRELSSESNEEQKLINSSFKYVFPILYKSQLMAFFTIGDKISKTQFTDEELEYIHLVSNITANALQNARNHIKLNRSRIILEERNQLLTTLFEMVHDFSFLLSREQIIKMLSLNLMGQLMVSRFAVYSLDDDGGIIEVINRIGGPIDTDKIKEAFNINFAQKIETLDDLNLIKLFNNRDIKVVSPMMVQGNNRGIMLICRKMNGDGFTDVNLQFVQSLSNTAISALENERLLTKEIEKKQLEKELEFALEIQKNLLPKERPIIEGYQLSGMSKPSRHVGGDYFDYIKLDSNRYLITIADVSGKGMPASLIMANFQAALKVLAPLNLSLSQIISRLNEIIYINTSYDKFVTCFCAILNYKEHKLTYINAGHNPPYLLRDNNFIELDKGGLILGIMDTPFEYEIGELELLSDDVLVLYTDGVTEALNTVREEYGESRLKEVMLANVSSSSEELITTLLYEIELFTSGANQYDDITIITVKKD